MRNKRVLPALLGSVALTLGLVTVSTSINKEVVNAAEEEVTATLSFANTAQRTEFSSSKQVWEQNGITFTNNKASSTTNVADYQNPVRLYASSSITVEMEYDISKIVFDCNSSSYATALKNSIGSDATASGDKVTVTLSTPASSFTVAKLTAQVRLDAITVTYLETGNAPEIDPDKDVFELVEKYVSDGIYTKETFINIDTNSEDLKEDLATIFHGKMSAESLKKNLNKTTYYNGNELWMTNEQGVNSGYGTVTTANKDAVQTVSPKAALGDMTHFKLVDNNQVYDYTVAIEGGMEAYYVTPKDFAVEGYFVGWEKEGEEFVFNNPELPEEDVERTVLSDFIDVVAPLLYWENSGNYFTYDKLVVKEDVENQQLYFSIVLDNTNAAGTLVSGSNNVLAQAIITKGNENVDFSYKLPGLDKVDFTFEDVTKTNTTKLTSEAALPYFTNELGENKDVLKELVVENVYEGNGTGGAFENTSGLLKLGTSKNNGKIVLTFDANSKFSTVTITCHAWKKGDSSKMSVNGVEIGMPNTGVASEITFSITESNIITIEPSARAFIFAISLD